MSGHPSFATCVAGCLVMFAVASPLGSQPPQPGQPARAAQTGAIKAGFFFYKSEDTEWFSSADDERLRDHLKHNATSSQLYTSLLEAVDGQEDTGTARTSVALWLWRLRKSQQANFGRVEAIVAYMRAYGFSAKEMVRALKNQSGASAVRLIAIHRENGESGRRQLMIKVVTEDAQHTNGKMGYNVSLQSPKVSYVTVVYVLAHAMYEVQELRNPEAPPRPDRAAASGSNANVRSAPQVLPSAPQQ